MKKATHNLMQEHLLGQLAYKYQCHPLKLNLKKVIEKLFKENLPRELATALDEFCTAALTDGYAWRQGSPANGLHLSKNIELLMEIAWLLHPKRDKNLIKKLPYRLQLSTNLLPMPLSAAEYWQPELFLSRFFKYQSLLQWKQLLTCFTENAIGSGSVAEELHSPELLNFNLYLKKLVYAVYCLGLGERGN